MKRLLVMFVGLLVLFGVVVSASISIKGDFESSYNLGDKVSGVVELNSVVEGDFLLKDYFDCGGKRFVFYASPLSLNAGENKEVSIPSFPIHRKLIGDCSVVASLENVEGDLIEEGRGPVFKVDSSLDGELIIDQTEVNQNGQISFSAKLEENKDYMIFSVFNKGDVSEEINRNFSGVIYEGNVSIPVNISKGLGDLNLRIEDRQGNSIRKVVSIDVLPVAAKLRLNVFNSSVKPLDGLSVRADLYDFFGAKMVDNVSVSILNEAGNVILESEVDSHSNSVVELDETSRPGEYSIVVKKGFVEVSEVFDVIELRDVDVDVDDGFLVLTNLGNINFGGVRVINASNSEGTVYGISMDLNIAPGEKQKFDLGKSLPEGKYEIVFGAGEVYHFLKEVIVEDKRSVSKKVSQGMSGLTGNAVIDTDSEKGFFGLVLFVLVGTCLAFLFSKNKLKSEFVGKIEGLMHKHTEQVGDLKGSLDKEKKESREIKKMFSRYVDSDVLREAGRKGMEKREISVLFTDIRGFSGMFEDGKEEEILKMLDMHFERISGIIKRNGGFINKFIGDSVMAIFNGAREDRDHVWKASKSALEIHEEINKLNEKLERKGFNKIKVGVGVDSGLASVGNLGGIEKMEYTAIGVPVNIASRIEGKALNGESLISDRVYQQVKDRIVAENMGDRKLKNIIKPVRVWNVLKIK